MSIVFPALAVAFAAFCVWLGVRIVNRRERWAKWMAAVVVALPVLYVLSFGPACWLASRANRGAWKLPEPYWPMTVALSQSEFIAGMFNGYARLASRGEWNLVEIEPSNW